MMIVSYIDILSNAKENQFEYEIEGEKIVATLTYIDDGQEITETDEFDFTNFQDGIMNDVVTTLSVNPILKAERKDGTLYVNLINFIGGYQHGGN